MSVDDFLGPDIQIDPEALRHHIQAAVGEHIRDLDIDVHPVLKMMQDYDNVVDMTFLLEMWRSSYQCIVHFHNGFGASIISSRTAYCSPNRPYELAPLFGDEFEFSISEGGPIGYLTEDEVVEWLVKLATNPRGDANG